MTATTTPENTDNKLTIRAAARDDCGLILEFINELAEYEKLAHLVSATETRLADSLFGHRPAAEVVIAEWQGEPAGFALFFGNYSTFLGRPGIYLEDLFVRPAFRGVGIGKALLSYLAALVVDRQGGRLEWWVLDWNKPSIDFYHRLGARSMSEWLPMRLEGDELTKVATKDTSANN
ncbi:MAG: GNAT family N-acetyltransferase [Gammaproteobacteria bacterium]